MDSLFNTVTNASSLVSKTIKDVTEVNIQDEATTVFSRAKQFTEEKLGRTERTEYEYEYQQLEKKTDLTKSYTEKLKNNTAAVIVPNPAVRAELLLYDNVPVSKLGLKREQLTNHEYLGADMIEAGNEFGPTTPYGSALIRVGQAEKRLGELEKEYIKNTNEGIIQPLSSFLDGEMKNVLKERKVLENKRLDLDASKSKVKKCRKDIMEQRPDDPYDARNALHQTPNHRTRDCCLPIAQFLQTLARRLEEVLIARILRALGLGRAAQMHGEVVQMLNSGKENPALAEDELQQCQVEFANQVEVAQAKMEDLSHIQVDHLKHLTALVQAQEEYYANGHKVMQELYRDLWGESVSLHNMNLADEKNGHEETSSQNGSDTSEYKSSNNVAFPSNFQVL